MSDPDALALRAARAGAERAHDLFRRDLAVETKSGKTDVVTRADREAQTAVAAVVDDADPDATLVGEEAAAAKSVPETGRAWVVDPIDGTHNYVRGGRCFTTSVCLVADGEPVAAANVLPAMDDTYRTVDDGVALNGTRVTTSDRTDPERAIVCPTIWWPMDRRDEYARATRAIVERFGDLKRPGSAQAALGRLAAGELDGVITNVETNPWDTIAGVHLVREAGGRVTDLDGDRWTHDARGLVASNGPLHDAVLDAARSIDAR
ncbi:inositol monophosphatase [Halomicrobium sp. HM KBTZ05]|uniref:inositol monophosphatase family protein n=1 Tax=Halomicrobium sp. HM KBTZ05 TaxID=3242663 RepID=UPI0035566EA9